MTHNQLVVIVRHITNL